MGKFVGELTDLTSGQNWELDGAQPFITAVNELSANLQRLINESTLTGATGRAADEAATALIARMTNATTQVQAMISITDTANLHRDEAREDLNAIPEPPGWLINALLTEPLGKTIACDGMVFTARVDVFNQVYSKYAVIQERAAVAALNKAGAAFDQQAAALDDAIWALRSPRLPSSTDTPLTVRGPGVSSPAVPVVGTAAVDTGGVPTQTISVDTSLPGSEVSSGTSVDSGNTTGTLDTVSGTLGSSGLAGAVGTVSTVRGLGSAALAATGLAGTFTSAGLGGSRASLPTATSGIAPTASGLGRGLSGAGQSGLITNTGTGTTGTRGTTTGTPRGTARPLGQGLAGAVRSSTTGITGVSNGTTGSRPSTSAGAGSRPMTGTGTRGSGTSGIVSNGTTGSRPGTSTGAGSRPMTGTGTRGSGTSGIVSNGTTGSRPGTSRPGSSAGAGTRPVSAAAGPGSRATSSATTGTSPTGRTSTTGNRGPTTTMIGNPGNNRGNDRPRNHREPTGLRAPEFDDEDTWRPLPPSAGPGSR